MHLGYEQNLYITVLSRDAKKEKPLEGEIQSTVSLGLLFSTYVLISIRSFFSLNDVYSILVLSTNSGRPMKMVAVEETILWNLSKNYLLTNDPFTDARKRFSWKKVPIRYSIRAASSVFSFFVVYACYYYHKLIFS